MTLSVCESVRCIFSPTWVRERIQSEMQRVHPDDNLLDLFQGIAFSQTTTLLGLAISFAAIVVSSPKLCSIGISVSLISIYQLYHLASALTTYPRYRIL